MLNSKSILSGIPDGLRIPLLGIYTEIVSNYAERRWEPSELNGGKLCEIAYCIVEGALKGTFQSSPTKPANMLEACRALEKLPPNPVRAGDRSLRILIPRLLPFLYEIRNNRGVGHVGGDVDPNQSDATMVYTSAGWLMAEFVRIFHQVTLLDAQVIVDTLVERKHAIIWEADGIKRVLDPSLSKGDQLLLLAYSSTGWSGENDLRGWVEYKNITDFRRNILVPLHKKRVLEFDAKNARVRITPLGIKEVEDVILKKYRS